MNLLDENFPDDERRRLQSWGIHVRQIGREVAESGIADDLIFPLLHRLKDVTFFSHDRDFFKGQFCHSGYSLVFLDVDEDQMAMYVRRFLRVPDFATKAQRMGTVARVNVEGIQYWRLGHTRKITLCWPQ